MEVAPLFLSFFKRRSQDLLHGLKLYIEGQKSKHDLYCDMADLLHEYQDKVEEFEREDEAKASPSALLFVSIFKSSLKGFLHGFKLYREGHKSKHDLNCDMLDLLRNLQDLVAEFASILADDEEEDH